MAMPISNTHLRVPRGFGAILEGLTREILRDQPKDIPKYAAEYFETLLKQREETGTDSSEWAAKLEDRYYNNHSFKTSDHASRTTVSNINSQVSVTEDYSEQSEDVSMTTMKTHHFNKSKEEESSPIITQAESAKQPLVASADPTTSTQADGLSNENNDSRASNNSESEGHEVQLLSETVNIDAQESEGGREDDDQENTDQEGKPGNVNITGKDLEETADAASVMKEDAEQKVAFESSEMRIQSPVSQLEITEEKQKQAIHDANDATSGDTEESSNNKSLAEITFDNVPENQKSMNNELRINAEIKEMTDTITNEQEVHLEEEKQDDENEENTSNHDYSMEESVGIIDTVHQPTAKGDHLVSEDTNNINNDENSSLKDNFEKVNFSQDTAATAEEGNEGQTDYQQIEHQKSFDKDAISDSTQLADSNVKMLEEQGEILERDEDDLLEHSEEEQCQEGTLEKYFTVSQDLQSEEEEESMVDGLSDSEVKEGHPPGNQDNVNPDLGQWTDKEDTGLHEEQQDTPDPEGQSDEKQEECSRPQEEEDIMDIPLDDPEANRAAAKIQAGFRGHMTRKKMKPEDKTEGEEVSSSGDVLNGSQGAQRQEDRGQ